MQGYRRAVDLRHTTFLCADAARKVAEVLDAERHISVERLAHGLAVVPGLGNGQLFDILLDAVSDLQEHVRALGYRRGAPADAGLVRRIQRQVDIGGVGPGDLTEDFAIHRRGVVEVASRDGRDPLSADVVLVARLEGNNGAFGTGFSVGHVFSLLKASVPRA